MMTQSPRRLHNNGAAAAGRGAPRGRARGTGAPPPPQQSPSPDALDRFAAGTLNLGGHSPGPVRAARDLARELAEVHGIASLRLASGPDRAARPGRATARFTAAGGAAAVAATAAADDGAGVPGHYGSDADAFDQQLDVDAVTSAALQAAMHGDEGVAIDPAVMAPYPPLHRRPTRRTSIARGGAQATVSTTDMALPPDARARIAMMEISRNIASARAQQRHRGDVEGAGDESPERAGGQPLGPQLSQRSVHSDTSVTPRLYVGVDLSGGLPCPR